MDETRTEDQPFDRLTELCAVMFDALEAEANHEVQGIIFLSDAQQSGIELFNYPSTEAGIAALLVHVKALLNSVGKGFGVMTDDGTYLMDPMPTKEESDE